MRTMPIVAVKPDRQVGGPLLRGFVGLGIGPFAQSSLDEALSFAILSSPGLQFVLTLKRA